MPDLDHRYARHPELFRCKNPAVPNHHLASVINHNRYNKSELADAIGDLIDLTLRMLTLS